MEEPIKIDYNELTRTKDGVGNAVVRPGKVYDSNGWYVTVRLSDLFDARLDMVEDPYSGDEEMCVCIPIRKNNILVTSKKNALITFKASVAERPTDRYTHVLTQVLEADHIRMRTDAGFSKIIVGHMRPVGFKPERKPKTKKKWMK